MISREVYNIELPGKEDRAKFFQDLIPNQTAEPPVKKAGEDIRSPSKSFLAVSYWLFGVCFGGPFLSVIFHMLVFESCK